MFNLQTYAFDQSDSHFIRFSDNCNRKNTSTAAVSVLTFYKWFHRIKYITMKIYSKFHIKVNIEIGRLHVASSY